MSPGPKLARVPATSFKLRTAPSGPDLTVGEVVSRVGNEHAGGGDSDGGGHTGCASDRCKGIRGEAGAGRSDDGVGDELLTSLHDRDVLLGGIDGAHDPDEGNRDGHRDHSGGGASRSGVQLGQREASPDPRHGANRQPEEEFGRHDHERSEQRERRHEDEAKLERKADPLVGAEVEMRDHPIEGNPPGQADQTEQDSNRVRPAAFDVGLAQGGGRTDPAGPARRDETGELRDRHGDSRHDQCDPGFAPGVRRLGRELVRGHAPQQT
jgi:hypothetical protein